MKKEKHQRKQRIKEDNATRALMYQRMRITPNTVIAIRDLYIPLGNGNTHHMRVDITASDEADIFYAMFFKLAMRFLYELLPPSIKDLIDPK